MLKGALAVVILTLSACSMGSGGAAGTVAAPQRTHAPTPRPLPRLSLTSIFSMAPLNLAGLDRRRIRTLIATGDVIPARSVNFKMVTYNDFLYPFRQTAAYLRAGDRTLINLEAPLISGCTLTNEGFTFCGDPRFVQGLQYAGIDIACSANNHIGNYGPAGLQETWAHLRSAGIRYCGSGVVDREVVRGLRFAFLAYNCVGQRFDYGIARQEIRRARRSADVVVVSVHWGKEYVPIPATTPGIADDDPRQVGHWIIDSGADLVIGNHPHHVQGVELYRGHLITYAHGNFVFDQMFSMATREGVVGTYTFYGKQLIAVRYRPVVIYDFAQPRWADRTTAGAVLAEMLNASRQMASRRA